MRLPASVAFIDQEVRCCVMYTVIQRRVRL